HTALGCDELHLRAGQALQNFVGADRVERGQPGEYEQGNIHFDLLVRLLTGPRRPEAVAVLEWADADAAGERPAHGLGCAEARGAGDVGGGESSRLEQPARDFDPNGFYVRGRRAADFVAEDPGEVARAHRYARREPLDRVVLVGMLGNPTLKVS